MAEVIEAAYKRPLDELVREKIWTPLGCEHDAYWGKDHTDSRFRPSAAFTPQRVTSDGSDRCTWTVACGTGSRSCHATTGRRGSRPAKLMDKGKPNDRYGYFWWLAEIDGKPIHYCRGFHGEYVVVIRTNASCSCAPA